MIIWKYKTDLIQWDLIIEYFKDKVVNQEEGEDFDSPNESMQEPTFPQDTASPGALAHTEDKVEE